MPLKISLSLRSLDRPAWRRLLQDKAGLCALLVVGLYFLAALGVYLGLWGSHWDELFNEAGYSSFSSRFWLGTNFNGQDIFQRALYGTKTAFQVGLSVALLSVGLGCFLGSLAGFYRGQWVDELIIWLYACMDSIPFYLFVAAVSFALKDSSLGMYIAMIAVMWTNPCKVIRGQVLKLKKEEFIEAARALGQRDLAIIYRHILPNTMGLVMVELSLAFITAIKTEAILSFLGLGLKEGLSWGTMLAEASTEVIAGIYHNFLAASLFMFGLVLAFNQLADALQDALDPAHPPRE